MLEIEGLKNSSPLSGFDLPVRHEGESVIPTDRQQGEYR